MSAVTANFLLGRHAFARLRWEASMARPGYKDDPDEEGPFTDQDWALYGWADAWRCLVHAIEAELHTIVEFREAERFSGDDGVTYYVASASIADLTKQVGGSRALRQEPKRPPKRGTQ